MAKLATDIKQIRRIGKNIFQFDIFVAGIIRDVAGQTVEVEVLLFIRKGLIGVEVACLFPESGLGMVTSGTKLPSDIPESGGFILAGRFFG